MGALKFMNPNGKSDGDAAFIKEVEGRIEHLRMVQEQLNTELMRYERILWLMHYERILRLNKISKV